MRVCLLYDGPAAVRNGRLVMHRVYGVYVDALAAQFESIVVCNTVFPGEHPAAQYEIQARNVSLVSLPHFNGIASSLPSLPACAVRIWKASRSWDVLHVTLPSPLGPIGHLCARARGIPVVLDIEGDLAAQYEAGRYRGLMGVAAGAAVRFLEWTTRRMVRAAVTFTQGNALLEKYRRHGDRIQNIPWSPMSERQIVEREDTCLRARPRLLFVGALLEKKGIFVLLEAAGILKRHLPDFVVTYVGMGPFAEELSRRVRAEGLEAQVELRGGVYREADLLREFDAADAFVFPTYSEGFPRVIFEAMARGLPVVSTRVSGIPALVDGSALLVDPGSPAQVAEAVLRIIGEPDLRRSLIRKGRAVAREYTLERTTQRRVDAIRAA